MQQTEGALAKIDSGKLKDLLRATFEQADFGKIQTDVEAFLLDPKEIRFFEKNYFGAALESLA